MFRAFSITFLAAFLIYLPAFITDFGFHNDYTMLSCDRTSVWGFIDSTGLFMLGRPLGGILITFQCWFLHRISDFAISRFVSFLGMFIWSWLLLCYFKKQFGLSIFWATVLAFGLFLLPASQVYTLWCTNLIPGTLNLLLASISYYLLEYAWLESIKIRDQSGPSRSRYLILGVCSMVFFLAALFIYPATAMLVFSLTFVKILFSPLSQWPQTRRIVLRDLIFFSLGILIYRIIERLIIFPWGVSRGFPQSEWHYVNMGVSLNAASKLSLYKETFLASLSGTWHLLWGNKGAFLTLLIIGCYVLFVFLHKPKFDLGSQDYKRGGWHILQIGIVSVILFILANLPCFLAKGVVELIGYRVLLPSSAIIIFIQFWLIQRMDLVFSYRGKRVSFAKLIAIALILCYGFITVWNVRGSVKNFNRELEFIRARVTSADFSKVTNFIIHKMPAYSGETLIGRKLPHEFGYMITTPQHAYPILEEQLKKMGHPMYPFSCLNYDVNVDDYRNDPSVCLIDLNELRFHK